MILEALFSISYREVEPLVVADSVGIILDKHAIGEGFIFIFVLVHIQQVSTLELGVEIEHLLFGRGYVLGNSLGRLERLDEFIVDFSRYSSADVGWSNRIHALILRLLKQAIESDLVF
jgi:hypothetical protein